MRQRKRGRRPRSRIHNDAMKNNAGADINPPPRLTLRPYPFAIVIAS